MSLDLILRDATRAGHPGRMDIAVADGRIAAIAPRIEAEAPAIACAGCLVVPGLVDTHVHLDKSGLSGRCPCGGGTLGEAIAAVAAAKRGFTEQDVYDRARATLEKAILHGTTWMRTQVEVDPRIGLTSLHALKRLKRDYAGAIDLQLCCFPQEGLLDDPGCDAVLVAALEAGADLVGGAPYRDRDSSGQIERIFALARHYDLDVDLHLDFDLDPSRMDLEAVCRRTEAAGWGGRVAIGHVTKLSALPGARLEALADRLAGAGVAVTALPATDLFLNGRDVDHLVPRGVAPVHRLRERGVTCSLATNNVLNPFTPFGDCSLVRLANLYANVAQLGTPDGLAACLAMVTDEAARLIGAPGYGIAVGNPADLVVLDAPGPAEAVATVAPVLWAVKGGRRTVTRGRPVLHCAAAPGDA